VYFHSIQKVTHWPITGTTFFICCFLAISTVTVNLYFVWKSKYFFVYIWALSWQVVSNLQLRSHGNKHLTFLKTIILTFWNQSFPFLKKWKCICSETWCTFKGLTRNNKLDWYLREKAFLSRGSWTICTKVIKNKIDEL
jgi:hypothetical protein